MYNDDQMDPDLLDDEDEDDDDDWDFLDDDTENDYIPIKRRRNYENPREED